MRILVHSDILHTALSWCFSSSQCARIADSAASASARRRTSSSQRAALRTHASLGNVLLQEMSSIKACFKQW